MIRLVWPPAANLSILVENVALARDNTQDRYSSSCSETLNHGGVETYPVSSNDGTLEFPKVSAKTRVALASQKRATSLFKSLLRQAAPTLS